LNFNCFRQKVLPAKVQETIKLTLLAEDAEEKPSTDNTKAAEHADIPEQKLEDVFKLF
jgi:hypothetical protein